MIETTFENKKLKLINFTLISYYSNVSNTDFFNIKKL